MTRCDDRRHSATPLDATTSLASLQVLEKASRELSVSLEVTQAGLESRRIAERNAKAGCLTQATPKPPEGSVATEPLLRPRQAAVESGEKTSEDLDVSRSTARTPA